MLPAAFPPILLEHRLTRQTLLLHRKRPRRYQINQSGRGCRTCAEFSKIAVAKILGGEERQRTRAFSELQSYYLFADKVGRPAKGNDKGKVEGLVGYARRNFMVPIPRVSSWEEPNIRLEAESRKRRLRRLRGYTETIGERFERDHAAMLPLPAAPYEACEKIAGRVSSLSLVRYRLNDYSVPTQYGHRQVWVKGYLSANVQHTGVPIDIFKLQVGDLSVAKAICTEQEVLSDVTASNGGCRIDSASKLAYDAPRQRSRRSRIANRRRQGYRGGHVALAAPSDEQKAEPSSKCTRRAGNGCSFPALGCRFQKLIEILQPRLRP
jgi:hypothetical protein